MAVPRLLPAAVVVAALLATGAAAQDDGPRLLSGPFTANGGHAWLADVPGSWPGDDLQGEHSRLVLLEDGRPLGPAHALHDDIRGEGLGRYSHWGEALFFSTSDNSDPNANGRTYSVLWGPGPGLGQADYRVLPPRGIFSRLDGPALERCLGAGAPRPAPDASDEQAGRALGAPRLIYWYTIDALRADAVDATVDGQPLMPALAAFAREAVRFEHAYSSSSFTKISTASMFTGLWPVRHGVMHGVLPVWPEGGELLFDLDERAYTLAEFLGDHGYATATHLFSVHVRPGDGMLQGFARLDLDSDGYDPLPEVPEHLFAYEHVLGVHGPYEPSERARARVGEGPADAGIDPASADWYGQPLDPGQARALHRAYLGEAFDADRRLAARLHWIRAQGLWDDAVVIVTSDHGEEFLEHGGTLHAAQLYEEVVHVPLLVKFPAGHPWARAHGTTVSNRVRLVDLYPTLAELVAGSAPELPYALDGESLGPILRGEETDPLARDVQLRTAITAQREDGQGPVLLTNDAIIAGRFKALLGYRVRSSQAPGFKPYHQGDWFAELYDLADDPTEQDDLSAERAHDFLALARKLRSAARPLRPAGAPAEEEVPFELPDEALLDRLKSLGYLR